MNTSNSKKTRLNKKFCITVLTSAALILLIPCKSSLGPPTISYYSCMCMILQWTKTETGNMEFKHKLKINILAHLSLILNLQKAVNCKNTNSSCTAGQWRGSLRASSPIWASGASLTRTREQGAESFPLPLAASLLARAFSRDSFNSPK